MKFSIAAIVALATVTTRTASAFSYLESLSTATAPTSLAPPPMAPPQPAAPAESSDSAPFFFTNGATDEPADSPAFFFTNGSTDVPAPKATTGSYLEHIGSGATSVSGPGMTSYLDALPQNSGVAGGPGISSYASSLNQDAASMIAAVVPEPEAIVPSAPSDFSNEPVPVAASAGNYLDHLSGGSTSVNGPGITSYLDALPQSPTLAGGAGISTYISGVTSTNVVSGPGLTSYTDAIGGGGSSSSYGSKTYSPFGSSTGAATGSAPAFAIGSVTGRFDFSLEADAELIEQLKAAGNRRVRLTGRVTSFSS